MFEIFFLAGPAIWGLWALAKKRGANAIFVTILALGGYVNIFLLSIPILYLLGIRTGLEFAAFAVRWLWLSFFYLLLMLLTRRRVEQRHSWQCPQCKAFSEPSAYYCLCGYENPAAKS